MKTLEDLHNYLVELELEALAQELAIVRYKAHMWDKYNREARIHKDLIRALEVTEDTQEVRRIFEENREELKQHVNGISAEDFKEVK